MSESTIAAILAALLPLIITGLIAWLERRGQEARRNAAIDAAHRQIQLLQLYLTTQQLILPAVSYEALKPTVGADVERVFRELTRILEDIERATQQAEGKNALQRLLLLYRLHTTRARLFRGLYYALLVISSALSLLFTIGTVGGQSASLVTAVLGIAIILLPVVALALLFRWLALREEAQATAANGTAA